MPEKQSGASLIAADYFKNFKASKNLREHSKQVEKLSLEIFLKLKDFVPNKNLDFKNSKTLLQNAAFLHDIGMAFKENTKEKHNKIGENLVLNNGIEGLKEDEVKIIASIIRHHRGSFPNAKKHKIFRALNLYDREKVLVLASILRLADALDTNHDSCVSEIEIEKTDGKFVLKTDVSLDFNKGLKEVFMEKKELFEKVFKTKIELI